MHPGSQAKTNCNALTGLSVFTLEKYTSCLKMGKTFNNVDLDPD